MPGTLRGNTSQRIAGSARVRPVRDIRERDDSDQPFLAVQHGQAPYLELGHIVCHVVDILVLKAVLDALARHYFPNGRASWISTMTIPSDSYVPVRDHADQAIILRDRQSAGISLGHHPRGMLKRVIRARDSDCSRHDFIDLHRCSPWTVLDTSAPSPGVSELA